MTNWPRIPVDDVRDVEVLSDNRSPEMRRVSHPAA